MNNEELTVTMSSLNLDCLTNAKEALSLILIAGSLQSLPKIKILATIKVFVIWLKQMASYANRHRGGYVNLS